MAAIPPGLSTDSSQTVQWRWQGEAFGLSAANDDVDGDSTLTTINLRFPGQYYDQETRLHYNWNRYYDPAVGRYVTSDPIGLAGGENSYWYVDANPVVDIDILGLRKIGRPGAADGRAGKGVGRTGGFGCLGGCVAYVDGDSSTSISISATIGAGFMVCGPSPEGNSTENCEERPPKKDCGIYDPNCDNQINRSGTGGKKGFGIGVQKHRDGGTCLLIGPFVSLPIPIVIDLGDVSE